MTTEYDLPYNGELSEGGDVPWAVLVESGQCDLMLISYMDIDLLNLDGEPHSVVGVMPAGFRALSGIESRTRALSEREERV